MLEHFEWWHALMALLTLSFGLWAREVRLMRREIQTAGNKTLGRVDRLTEKVEEAHRVALDTRNDLTAHRLCTERRLSRLEVLGDKGIKQQ